MADKLQERIELYEIRFLQEFEATEVKQELETGKDEPTLIAEAIRRAFVQCDNDLSREIEESLKDCRSNILLHYYLSLAVSGACASVTVLHQNHLYVANTGDCRAVMGVLKENKVPQMIAKPSPGEAAADRHSSDITRKFLKTIHLSEDHNSDNAHELNRLMAAHPKKEHNNIIRQNRLLGMLMPLRAFGDYSFKWTIDQMKQLGLTKAFGPHIIPAHYRTPPYLTAEPDVKIVNLAEEAEEGMANRLDRFVVIATDGLWEQFETSRGVIKTVNRHRQNLQHQFKVSWTLS